MLSRSSLNSQTPTSSRYGSINQTNIPENTIRVPAATELPTPSHSSSSSSHFQSSVDMDGADSAVILEEQVQQAQNEQEPRLSLKPLARLGGSVATIIGLGTIGSLLLTPFLLKEELGGADFYINLCLTTFGVNLALFVPCLAISWVSHLSGLVRATAYTGQAAAMTSVFIGRSSSFLHEHQAIRFLFYSFISTNLFLSSAACHMAELFDIRFNSTRERAVHVLPIILQFVSTFAFTLMLDINHPENLTPSIISVVGIALISLLIRELLSGLSTSRASHVNPAV